MAFVNPMLKSLFRSTEGELKSEIKRICIKFASSQWHKKTVRYVHTQRWSNFSFFKLLLSVVSVNATLDPQRTHLLAMSHCRWLSVNDVYQTQCRHIIEHIGNLSFSVHCHLVWTNLQGMFLSQQKCVLWDISVMACSHCTGPGMEQGTGDNGFLYYTMYCAHYTRTGTGNHCFLLCPSRSLSLSHSRSRAVCLSHSVDVVDTYIDILGNIFLLRKKSNRTVWTIVYSWRRQARHDRTDTERMKCFKWGSMTENVKNRFSETFPGVNDQVPQYWVFWGRSFLEFCWRLISYNSVFFVFSGSLILTTSYLGHNRPAWT